MEASMMRLFLLFFLAIAWMFKLESCDSRERDETLRPDRPRYLVYFPNYALPVFLVFMALLIPFNSQRVGNMLLGACFSISLHTSIYYIFLALTMPLLRRKISSRVCASLWLLPNYLYLLINRAVTPTKPKWAIYVPEGTLKLLCLVWLVGFLAVMVWKIVGHFRFRRELLKVALPVEEADVIALWNDELELAGYADTEFPLFRSPAVQSPLTVGFFKSAVRVVLPERSYTPEELRLIFRHEIIHIGRDDAGSKFFLVFCTAMCWFNPLMWWAMRKSADDLELSCDETVLLDSDDSKRRQYADLLLRTAGDERGFTTCLSASARAMQYRLRWVINPVKRFTGSFLAGCILFVLFLSAGHVTLAFEKTTGAELIFGGQELSRFEVEDNELHRYDFGSHSWPEVKNADALKEYLAELKVYAVSDIYELSDSDRDLTVTFLDGKKAIWVGLGDHALLVGGTERKADHYFLPEETDWDYLDGLLRE